MKIWVKVCGVTTVADAQAAVAAGVDAIGLNFVPSSKRYLEPARARALVEQVGHDAVTWVGVVADESFEALSALRHEVPLHLLQLHGAETPEALARLQPGAFKALSIASSEDVARAESFGGDRILVDARAPGALGGTGHTFDWSLVVDLVGRRPTVLAGGLHPGNVAEAVTRLGPWGVDVASGVEHAPGRKDGEAMRRFVELARAAAEHRT
jgi:phosphoribosylanthranilate isomerase